MHRTFFSFLIYLFDMTLVMFVCIFHFPPGLCWLYLLILHACVRLSQSGHCLAGRGELVSESVFGVGWNLENLFG